ncbi:MAG: aminotransferase class III-fold pyridoxal phosphate-dependent enzyme [Actinomycetota bacterium]|nr:aminotransferase class III-fold pyridoxal phosphate-dependent enzyme [Actinomycetota bacterium]
MRESTRFVQGIRRTTAELGIALIVDEVQTGGGRTGTWFAFEQHGIVPDVIVASKAMGGAGMPLAIILHKSELDTFAPPVPIPVPSAAIGSLSPRDRSRSGDRA